MKPANYISLIMASLVMVVSVGCKKTEKPNTFLPAINGAGTTGNGSARQPAKAAKSVRRAALPPQMEAK